MFHTTQVVCSITVMGDTDATWRWRLFVTRQHLDKLEIVSEGKAAFFFFQFRRSSLSLFYH